MPSEAQEAMFAGAAKALPAGCVGTPEVIGQAALCLLQNRFITGTVLDVDGGYVIKP